MQKYEILSFPVSFLFYLSWALTHWIRSKELNNEQNLKHSGIQQRLIIAAIILLLFPLIVAVLHALSFPLLLGSSWIIAHIPIPNAIASIIRFTLMTAILSICFIAAHKLCAPLWPKHPLTEDSEDILNSNKEGHRPPK
jgi:uncharacterized membrane protein